MLVMEISKGKQTNTATVVSLLSLAATAGLAVAILATFRLEMWTDSKGVVIAQKGDWLFEVIRVVGLAISGGSLGALLGTLVRQRVFLFIVFGATLTTLIGLPVVLIVRQALRMSQDLGTN